MEIRNCVAFVTGGASGLGEATVRKIVGGGGSAAILDLAEEKGQALANELGDCVMFLRTDITEEASVQNAIDKAVEAFGAPQILVNCAGASKSKKVIGREGPVDLDNFAKYIHLNLIGTFNVIRLVAAKMVTNTPNKGGERGVIINTASIAAFEGQIGQAAYSAAKGGIVSMTLPIAREFATHGIRVMTIAPGIFLTPMFAGASEKLKQALSEITPFPSRLGYPEEFAMLVQSIIENPMLNGSTIRLDGALRLSQK